VQVRPGLTVPRFVLEWSQRAPQEAAALLARFDGSLTLAGRSVLVVGRGAGDLGVEVAHQGARRVVAADMAMRRLKLTAVRLDEAGEPAFPVELQQFDEGLARLGDESFEVVLASDAFRLYAGEPSSRHLEHRLAAFARRLTADGLLAVAFGPPWRAPYGGGGDSRLPWAHLIFPESVIFEEFRRARKGSAARGFDDVGVHRITLARFRHAIGECGLEPVWCRTNVGTSGALRVMRGLSRAKPFEEYLTQNLLGVWRRPRPASSL